MPKLALLDITGNLATLTLNRADAHNAMSIDMLADAHACNARIAR